MFCLQIGSSGVMIAHWNATRWPEMQPSEQSFVSETRMGVGEKVSKNWHIVGLNEFEDRCVVSRKGICGELAKNKSVRGITL